MPEPTFEPIAIVGMGCVFPGARSADELWANVCAGVDAIADVPPGRWDATFYDPEAALEDNRLDRFYCRRGGFVDDVAEFDPTAFGIMPVVVDGGEPDQFLALAQAAAALDDSGKMHERVPSDRVGVIVGRGGYGTPGVARLNQRVHVTHQFVEGVRALLPEVDPARLERVRDEFMRRLGPARPEASIGLVPNLAASRVANRLDFHGPAYTVDAACASTLLAVDQAARELASGRCDLVLAGGVHHCHDVTLWSLFSQLRALSPSEQIKPFSRRADGVLIGEGTGFFALERLADAKRAGDRIYAVIRGSGVASDGRAKSLMSPDAAGQVLALRRAWASASLDPATVGLVEAHGTATPAGDEAELQSLREVFGSPNGDGHAARAGLGSIKSMIGHAMPAAGAAGLAKAALALHHRVLPPTLHADEPHPLVEATRFRLIHRDQPWESDGPRRAGVDAFGFGGINAHLVLEEAPGAASAALAGASRRPASVAAASPVLPPTLLLAADDTMALVQRLDDWLATHGEAARPSVAEAPEGGPARLAVVDVNPHRLELARKVLAQGTPWRGRNGVWFEPHGLLRDGQLAFVFPGFEPTFEPRVDDVARHFGLEQLAAGLRPASGDEMSGRERQSRGILAVGRLVHRALGQLGIAPDMVAGHSWGEWSAAAAAGVVLERVADELAERIEPGAVEQAVDLPDVVYLAVLAGVDVARELVDGLERTVVSHDNCPHQSVVCGPPGEVAVAAERGRARRVMTQELPFRSGFHTPLFAPHVESLHAAFAALAPLNPPSVPLWSATTCRPYPADAEGHLALAERHLVEPVRFRELVLALHGAGARVFVQSGVGNVAGFVEDTLRDHEAVTIPANIPKRSGLEQLCHLAAAVWVEGRDVSFDRLVSPAGATRETRPAERPRRAGRAGRAMKLDLGTRLVRELTPLDSAATPRASEASPAADQTRVWRRRFALEEEPAWRDHILFRQADGWPHAEDLFPIVPMTGIVEILAESAAEGHPGLRPVAVEDVAAFRWLVVAPPAEVTMRAVPQESGPDGCPRVKVTIDGHARATVVLAPAHPAPPPDRPEALLVGEGPSPIDAERFYVDRHMFHGPAYQGVERFLSVADNGARAILRAPSAPGGLLDNAGQLLGHWLGLHADTNRVSLPIAIRRIDFFGPHPAPGTLVDCTVTVHHLDERTLRSNLYLSVDGRLWCRINDWENRRFTSDTSVIETIKWPERAGVSEGRDGYTLVRDRWPDAATCDMIMRRYLGRNERRRYEVRHPLGQRRFLVGRIAVKDAVRRQLWAGGHGDLFPAEVVVAEDGAGRPLVRGPYPADLRVSYADADGLGVAAVAEGQPAGIHIERVQPRRGDFEQLALTPHERGLEPPAGYGRDAWLTCLWVVKEAAAKASGRGLQGRPHDFEVTERRDETVRVDHLWVAFERLTASTETESTTGPTTGPTKEHIVAWTLTDR